MYVFPSNRPSSWIRPLVVFVSVVYSVSICVAGHMYVYVCVAECVYVCVYWEYMFSLTTGETWRHGALWDYQIWQAITETVIFHLHSREITPETVRFCNSLF